MRVLIVENEIYLAQSIASKLGEEGYECEIVSNVKDALNTKNSIDAILLSTSLNGQNIYPIIEKFKNSIIILLISYISNDTVSNPIKAGADDYMQKPFTIEELVRKIKHFKEFKALKIMNKTCMDYINSNFAAIKTPNYDIKKLKFPLVIRTAKQIYADGFVFSTMKELGMSFNIIFMNDENAFEMIKEKINMSALYLQNFQLVPPSEREKIFNLISKKMVIISTTDLTDTFPFETLNIASSEADFGLKEIMSVDGYIKFVISTYQNVLPDTELSQKLGMTRKSLWEKRKKYGIARKK